MRKRKKRYVLRAMLLLLAAVLIGVGFYLYPTWRAARILEDNGSLPYSSFEMEVELDREKLPQEQEKMLRSLARLTGIQEEAMYRLSIKGSSLEDRVHLMIYPDGESEPLFEFYQSNDTSVINETMLYNAIRSNLTEQFGLLEYLMPRQEETLYMTLEQVEQLFGTNLSGFGSFQPLAEGGSITAKGYFTMLAMMSREKQADGYRFALETGQIALGYDVKDAGGNGAVRVRLQIRNLSETSDKGDRLLSQLGNWLSGEKLRGLKSFSMTLVRTEEGTIMIPTNLVNQEIIERISGIRAWIQETFG